MFKNKNVFITGARGGIGHAIIEAFASQRATVFAHARNESKDFTDFINETKKKYDVEIIPVYFDICNKAEMKNAIKEIQKTYRIMDVLINNAGVAHGGFFQMTSVDEIRKVFDINFFSICELSQLIVRMMTRQKSGAIINMASVSGLDLNIGNCAYGTSKAAVIALTKTLAKEFASYGIRVNAIAPGLTDTNMAKLMEEKAGDAMVRDTAMNRLAKPEEIADVAVYLASEKASFITGQVLRVDGGM